MRADLRAYMVTVAYGCIRGEEYGWAARLHWQDPRFCESKTVEGTIKTRYFELDMATAIDAVLEVADTFSLDLSDEFAIFYESDGSAWYTEPPPTFMAQIKEEAKRRGWHTYKDGRL